MKMHNLAHPGEVVREDCSKPLGLTITAAVGLGVTRKALSGLLNGHSGVVCRTAARVHPERTNLGGFASGAGADQHLLH
jgi:plasmid maintenance system antidote protein VapI